MPTSSALLPTQLTDVPREVVGVTQNWNEGFLGWVPTHKDQCPGVETILEVPGSLAESILR